MVEALILYEKGIKSKLSGNEVYSTNSFILLVKNMLCSKISMQPFPYKIQGCYRHSADRGGTFWALGFGGSGFVGWG